MKPATRPLLFVIGLGTAAACARGEELARLGTLARESDCVLWALVGEGRPLATGRVHAVTPRRALMGAQPGGGLLVFAPDPELPDAPRLERGEEVILGVRWNGSRSRFPDQGVWPQAHGGEGQGAAGPIPVACDALLVAGGKLPVAGRADLVEAVAGWLAAVEVPVESAKLGLLLPFVDHAEPALRLATLLELALTQDPLEPAHAALLETAFREEAESRRNAACLRGWINLVQAGRLAGVGPVVRELVLSSPDPTLSTLAAGALAMTASGEDRLALLSEFHSSRGQRRARVLLALSRLEDVHAISFSREAIGDEEAETRQAARSILDRIEEPATETPLAAEQVLRDIKKRNLEPSAEPK